MYKFCFLTSLFYLLFNFSLTSIVYANTGTTLYLKEIFLGRCFEYQTASPYSRDSSLQIDCYNLFNLFIKPFKGVDECQEKDNPFDEFFKEVNDEIPINKGLFWSRTSSVAHDVSKHGINYVTLEDTLPGYLVNNMSWCGQQGDPGMNYDQCKRACPGEESSINYEFWIQASINFARSVSGMVTVLLNGSLNPDKGIFAFNEKSIMAKYELPNFRKNIVTKVRAILIHTLDAPKREFCSSPSMIKLKNKVLERGFQYDCVENPKNIKLLLCAYNPDAADCDAIIRVANANTSA